MTTSEHERAGAGPRPRRRWIFSIAALAAVVLAAVVGAAIAFGRSPAATPRPAAPATAAPTTPDPYRLAGDICTDGAATMEKAITVAQQVLPDAESRADFLGTEARAIDTRCPALRSRYDQATMAAAGEVIGPPPP